MKTERKQSRREKVPKKPGFNGAERPSSPDLQASERASSWGLCNLKLNLKLLHVSGLLCAFPFATLRLERPARFPLDGLWI